MLDLRLQKTMTNMHALKSNKKVWQQSPSTEQNNIIQIINTNFYLIMDEQRQRQPIGLFTAFGINLENEKMFISKKRKINAEEDIPRYLAFIRHSKIC